MKKLDAFIDQRAFRPLPSPYESYYLHAEQIHTYDRDGFVIIRDILNTQFVDRLRLSSLNLQAVDKRSVKDIEKHDPIFQMVYENSVVRFMVEDLNGPSDMCQSFVFFKSPKDQRPKPWHQDSAYWGTSDETMTNVFVPLTPSNKRNGGVHFFPGSHLLGRIFHHVEDDGFGFQNLVCNVTAFKEPVCPDVNPGDLIICHNLTVHGSFSNDTDATRINIGFHHKRRGTTLEWR